MTRIARRARQAWRYLWNPWLLEARVEIEDAINRHPASNGRGSR